MCSTKYDFNIPDLCPKPLIITGVAICLHFKKMSLYASVCNNTIVMWPLFIELIVSFCVKISQGKFM